MMLNTLEIKMNIGLKTHLLVIKDRKATKTYPKYKTVNTSYNTVIPITPKLLKRMAG